MIKKKPQKSRADINEQSKQLKRKKKHKGLPSGSKFNQTSSSSKGTTKEAIDPRIGSKKPIALVVESNRQPKVKKEETVVKKKPLSPERELEQLENDPYLDQLLELADNDQKLSSKQQQDLDTMLDRIHQLMEQLGYIDEEDEESDDDEEDEFEKKEDIVSLLKKR